MEQKRSVRIVTTIVIRSVWPCQHIEAGNRVLMIHRPGCGNAVYTGMRWERYIRAGIFGKGIFGV
jgi:hypothetical protein